MALGKQNVPISISKGLNTKQDPKQETEGQFTEIQNVRYAKIGEVQKRFGHEEYVDRWQYLSGNTYYSIENVKGVTSVENQVCFLSTNFFYTSFEPNKTVINQGLYRPINVTTQKIDQEDFDNYNVSSCSFRDMSYTIYTLKYGPNYYTYLQVQDQAKKVPLIKTGRLLIGTNYSDFPKIIPYKDKIVIIARDAESTSTTYNMPFAKVCEYNSYTELTREAIDANTTAGGWKQLSTAAWSRYDVATCGDYLAIVWADSTSANVHTYPYVILTDSTSNTKYLAMPSSTPTTYIITPSTGTVSCLDAHNIITPATGTDLAQDGLFVTVGVDGDSKYYYQIYNSLLSEVHSFSAYMRTDDPSVTNTKTVSITTVSMDNLRSNPNTPIEYHTFIEFELDGTTGTDIDNEINYVDKRLGNISYGKFNNTTEFNSTAGNIWSSGVILTSTSTATGTDITGTRPDYSDLQKYATRSIYHRELFPPAAYTPTILITEYPKIEGQGLAAKPFVRDGEVNIVTCAESELQSSFFIVSPPQRINSAYPSYVGHLSYGEASGVFSQGVTGKDLNSLPEIFKYDDDTFIFPFTRKGKLVSNEESFFHRPSATIDTFDFDEQIAGQSKIGGKNLMVAGAVIGSWDKGHYNEFNFLQSPYEMFVWFDGMTRSTLGVFTAGADDAGTGITGVYSYKALYSYQDLNGITHRSAVSPMCEVKFDSTVTGAANYDEVHLIVPTITETAKGGDKITIEIYRTTVNGLIFYKVSDQWQNDSTYNFPTNNNNDEQRFLVFKDMMSDLDLETQQLLYTEGGVLENIPPGPAAIIEPYKNRMFLAGRENKNQLLYSKLRETGETPVEFNDTLTMNVPSAYGEIVSLKTMDNKLIIFCDHAICYLAGEGPDNTGLNDDFIRPQLITNDIGCTRRNSVAMVPKGLVFKSQKGIWQLNRALDLEYIGAPVEDYNDLTITKTDVLPILNEARFLTSDGDCLVYNYLYDIWYTFSNHRGFDSHVLGNDYYFVNHNSKILKIDYDRFDDNGSPVQMRFHSGWISFAGIQGYQRIWRIMILGEYKSPHKLKIKIAYNYDDVWAEEKIIDVTSYTESYAFGGPIREAYGSPVSTGTGSPPGGTEAIAYGGKDNTQYQIRINPQKQKCESIKILVEEIQNTDQLGPGLSISNVAFLAGLKGGQYKIKQARNFGSTSIT